MLIFEKVDEVYFIVKSDSPENFTELQELYFAFILEHPDKYFIPAYKNGGWDGKVKFIKYLDSFRETALAPIGLFHKMYKFMKSNNIEFEIINDDIGINKVDLSDFDSWLSEIEKGKTKKISSREYQYNAVKNALIVNRGILQSPTGCHAKGDKVFTNDGVLKKVEDIVEGDFLFGIDGQYKEVLSLFNGYDDLYEIKPFGSDIGFTVNSEHVLPLYYDNNIIELTVHEFLAKDDSFKEHCQIFYNKEKLNFSLQNDEYIIDSPYHIGEYFGQMFNDNAINDENDEYLYYLNDILFKTSVNFRLELLAGMLDSGGDLIDNNSKFSFSSSSKSFIDNMHMISISLGYICSINIDYDNIDKHIITISGNISSIPTKNKQINHEYIDNYKNGFDIIKKGYGEYYGFTVKDSLYLTESGIITKNSGKSLIIYTYISWILTHEFKPGEKLLLVVPSTSLVEQMTNDFVEYGFNEKYISKIYSGQTKNFNNPIIISTWQSLFRNDIDFFEQFSCVIIDEAHKAKAKQMMYISENCINARFRLATTGTLHKQKFMKWSVMANFGPVFKTSTTSSLIKSGFLTDFHIRNIVINWKKVNCKKIKRFDIDDYQDEFKHILNNENRMDMVITFLVNLWDDRDIAKSTLLVMGRRVAYIEFLFSKIKDKIDGDVFFIHGKVKTSDRLKIIEHVKKYGGMIIANIDIMGTGINIPNVSTIVFANPVKSDILLLQTIGRSIRLSEGKTFAMIYDLVDKIPIKNKSENTVYSWLGRKNEIYQEQGFKYDTINVDLNCDCETKFDILKI